MGLPLHERIFPFFSLVKVHLNSHKRKKAVSAPVQFIKLYGDHIVKLAYVTDKGWSPDIEAEVSTLKND